MKKFLIFIVSAVMISALCACGEDKGASDDSTGKIIVSDADSGNIGGILRDEFNRLLGENPDMSAQEIADTLMTNSAVTFQGMTASVENGLLTGFGNTEITGFKEGIMFGPMIGSIPFVGYIFVLDDNTDMLSFMTVLNNRADKRWLVCAEADDIVVDNVGNKVFFVMSPEKIEE